MICKYKYKGKWYSEDEIKNLLGEEFFKNDLLKISEFGSSNEGTKGYSIVRNASLNETFDNTDQLLTAQKQVIKNMSHLIYIGDVKGSEFVAGLENDLKQGIGPLGIRGEKKGMFVPETLDIAIANFYQNLVKFLDITEARQEKEETISEGTLNIYSALVKLRNYRDHFKPFIAEIFPEAKSFMTDSPIRVVENIDLVTEEKLKKEYEEQQEEEGDPFQSIFSTIESNTKVNQEKSQSKLVKFITNFVEYEATMDRSKLENLPKKTLIAFIKIKKLPQGPKESWAKERIINHILKHHVVYKNVEESRNVYKILLDVLTKSFDTNNLTDEVERVFSQLIDIEPGAMTSKESPKNRRIRAIYNKVRSLTSSMDNYYNNTLDDKTLKAHPIFSKLDFVNENTFVYDKSFNPKNKEVFNGNNKLVERDLGSNYETIVRKKNKKSIESTYAFLTRIVETVNKDLKDNQNVSENLREVDLLNIRDLWAYNYNKRALADLISLMKSQRDSHPYTYEISGRYGQIKITIKTTGKGGTYSLRSSFRNIMAQELSTIERIKEFKKDPTIKKMMSDIDSSNFDFKERGVKTFLRWMYGINWTGDLQGTENQIKDAAKQLKIVIDSFVKVNVTEKELAEREESDTEIPDRDDMVTSEQIVSKNAGTLTTLLSDFIDKNDEYNLNPMVISPDGTSFYKFHNGSYIEDLHDLIATHKKFEGQSTGKERTIGDNSRIPNEIKNNPEMQRNPIVTGVVPIGNISIYRGLSNYSYPVMYTGENTNHWFIREFSGGFIESMFNSKSYAKMMYEYFYPPISNKPNAKSVTIGLHGSNDVVNRLQDIVKIIRSRPKILNKVIANYDSEDSNLFRLYDNHKNIKDSKKVAELIYKDLIDSSIDQANDFVIGNELYITTRITDARSLLQRKGKITDEFHQDIFDRLKEKDLLSEKDESYGTILPSENFSFGEKNTNSETNKTEKSYNVKIADMIDMFTLFQMNNYINTFLISHLTTGDPSYFKNENDYIKRLSGPFSPGIVMISNPVLGFSKPHANVLVLKDSKSYTSNGKTKPWKDFFKELLDNPTKEELDFLNSMFEETGFDRADAQGFMTEERLEDIKKGSGNPDGQGTVLKPVHYSKREMRITRSDGRVLKYYVPTMIKYAAMALTKEMRKSHPKLNALASYMENNGIDEVVFESGVKVGRAQSKFLYTIEDIIEISENAEDRKDEFNGLQFGDNRIIKEDELDNENNRTPGLMVLENSGFRLQQNPTSSKGFHKLIKQPSQIIYVLNVASNGNHAKAKTIYESLNEIQKLQSDELAEALSTGSSSYITKVLKEKFVGRTNEVYAEMLKQGVDINFPGIADKATIQFSSYISSEVLSIPFEGGKFQLVSDIIYNHPDTGLPLRIVKDKETGAVYGEVLVPEKFKNKFPLNSMFGIDGFTIRIPTSGLHSTMPFKIVGYTDFDSDMFVGPQEMVPIQGSDFDADAVFVIRDNTWSDFYKRVASVLKRDSIKKALKIYIEENYSIKGDTRIVFPSTDNGIIEDILVNSKIDFNEKDYAIVERMLKVTMHKQNIVESIKTIITDGSNENIKELLSPIYMGLINGKKSSVYRHIADSRKLKDTDDLLGSLDLGMVENKYLYYRRNFDGNALTGIFANLFKAVSYLDKAGRDGKRPTINPVKKDFEYPFNNKKITSEKENIQYPFNNKEFDKEKFSNRIVIGSTDYHQMQEATTFNGKSYPIRTIMDIFINLAIDNVKEQGLPTINASGQTASTYVMGLSLGIPLEDMVGLMLSPMAQKITYYGKASGLGMVAKLMRDINPDISDKAKTIKITKELLKKQLAYDKTSLEDLSSKELTEQYALFLFYKKIQRPAKELNELSMYLKVVQDMHVNFQDIEKVESYFGERLEFDEKKYLVEGESKYVSLRNVPIEDVEYKSEVFDMPNLFTSAPHIFTSVVAQGMLHDYLAKVMLIYSKDEYYDEFLNRLESNVSGFNITERRSMVRREIMHFFASSVKELDYIRDSEETKKHPTYAYTMSNIDTWQFRFAEKVETAQKQLRAEDKSNYFLNAVQYNSFAVPGRPFLSLSMGRSMDPFDIFKMHEDFKKLDDNLQSKFYHYTILFYGSKFGSSNFTLAIPPSKFKDYSRNVKLALEEYIGSKEKFTMIQDLIEAEVMRNSFSSLASFNRDSIGVQENRSIELKNGNTLYYDMSHGINAKANIFQVDKQIENEKEEKNESEGSSIDLQKKGTELEEEVTETSIIPTVHGKSYVVNSYKDGGGYSFNVYRRINISKNSIKDGDKSLVYYKKLGKIRNSKYYSFSLSEGEGKSKDTFGYELETAFTPEYPHVRAFSKDFGKKEITKTVTTKPGLLPDQNVIMISLDDMVNRNPMMYSVKGTKKVKSTGNFEITFTLKDNLSIPDFNPQTYYGKEDVIIETQEVTEATKNIGENIIESQEDTTEIC
jgi:hypothetical protein